VFPGSVKSVAGALSPDKIAEVTVEPIWAELEFVTVYVTVPPLMVDDPGVTVEVSEIACAELLGAADLAFTAIVVETAGASSKRMINSFAPLAALKL